MLTRGVWRAPYLVNGFPVLIATDGGGELLDWAILSDAEPGALEATRERMWRKVDVA